MYPVIHKERIERERERERDHIVLIFLPTTWRAAAFRRDGVRKKNEGICMVAAALALSRRKTKSLTRIDEQF